MFYLINKEKGYSSFKKIKDFSKVINSKKIGHAGTLDPLATGLLLVATNEDTKLIKYILNQTKTYIVKGQFGFETDTYDILGSIINSTTDKVNKKIFVEKLSKLSKKNTQIPPMYSAKKINGVRGYKLARKGIDFTLKLQRINIYNYEIIYFDEFTQEFSIKMHVSAGTYIRTLIHDLGRMCNNYATMLELKRTKIGELNIKLLTNKDYYEVSPDQLFSNNFYEYTYEQAKLLKNGVGFETEKNDGIYFLKDKNRTEVCGIVEIKNKKIKVKKIFPQRLL